MIFRSFSEENVMHLYRTKDCEGTTSLKSFWLFLVGRGCRDWKLSHCYILFRKRKNNVVNIHIEYILGLRLKGSSLHKHLIWKLSMCTSLCISWALAVLVPHGIIPKKTIAHFLKGSKARSRNWNFFWLWKWKYLSVFLGVCLLENGAMSQLL